MNDIAIKVENISKRYRIGLKDEIHETFMGALTSWVKYPMSNFKRLQKLSRFSDNDDSEDIIWALNNVSFEVNSGEVLGIIGKNGAGKIVLFGSNVTRIGLPFGSAYSASKAALANIARTLAAEEAQNNIIVNIISPGPVKIDDSHFSESYRKFREEYYRKNLREIPLQRCASFEDLFGLCNFLLSAENSYITGEEFFVTGGKV